MEVVLPLSFFTVKEEPEDWFSEEERLQEQLQSPVSVYLAPHEETEIEVKNEEDPLAFEENTCNEMAEQGDYVGSPGE
ncbi:Protein of unknown function [Gryllus bimaculatus]|nr:Protein of unknown function [Gryllus bimaculatus]